jgi:hypothetical protein
MENQRLLDQLFSVASMAAFSKSVKMAICHNFFIDCYLQKIFTCYKMARWPLIVLQIFFLCATFRDTIRSFLFGA